MYIFCIDFDVEMHKNFMAGKWHIDILSCRMAEQLQTTPRSRPLPRRIPHSLEEEEPQTTVLPTSSVRTVSDRPSGNLATSNGTSGPTQEKNHSNALLVHMLLPEKTFFCCILIRYTRKMRGKWSMVAIKSIAK